MITNFYYYSQKYIRTRGSLLRQRVCFVVRVSNPSYKNKQLKRRVSKSAHQKKTFKPQEQSEKLKKNKLKRVEKSLKHHQ